jgi:hypothetical protein
MSTPLSLLHDPDRSIRRDGEQTAARSVGNVGTLAGELPSNLRSSGTAVRRMDDARFVKVGTLPA